MGLLAFDNDLPSAVSGHTGTTDKDEDFKIKDIPPGNYPVVITDKDGNVIGTGEITIGEPGGGDFMVTTVGNSVITPVRIPTRGA